MTALPQAVVDQLRQLLDIPRILAAAGIALPIRGDRIPCPLHGGGNPQAFRFNAERFQCFNCGAVGDVFELIHRLHGTTGFRDSLRVAASIAGVAIEGARSSDRKEVERQATLRRLRAALRRSREERLNNLARQLYDYDRDADKASFVLTSSRYTKDEERAWDLLGEVQRARDAAEWKRARLESDNESDWLHVLDELGGAACGT